VVAELRLLPAIAALDDGGDRVHAEFGACQWRALRHYPPAILECGRDHLAERSDIDRNAHHRAIRDGTPDDLVDRTAQRELVHVLVGFLSGWCGGVVVGLVLVLLSGGCWWWDC
jgi:hypothetical protein